MELVGKVFRNADIVTARQVKIWRKTVSYVKSWSSIVSTLCNKGEKRERHTYINFTYSL